MDGNYTSSDPVDEYLDHVKKTPSSAHGNLMTDVSKIRISQNRLVQPVNSVAQIGVGVPLTPLDTHNEFKLPSVHRHDIFGMTYDKSRNRHGAITQSPPPFAFAEHQFSSPKNTRNGNLYQEKKTKRKPASLYRMNQDKKMTFGGLRSHEFSTDISVQFTPQSPQLIKHTFAMPGNDISHF